MEPSPSDPRARRFSAMVSHLLRNNTFYRTKLATAGFTDDPPPSLADLASLPLTTKAELVADQAAHPPYGSNLTEPLRRYTRIHQTSGSTGQPLRWLDTAESWAWWIRCWQAVYRAAGISADDRIFVAFSFGPFIGFWSAFEAAHQLGALVLPGGAQTTEQRLATIQENRCTALVCTPTYALRLAEVAHDMGLDLHAGPMTKTVHAGEPGASLPNVRHRIEQAWGARCTDHAGATEVGAWGYGCGVNDHVHVNDDEFIAEVIPDGGDHPEPPAVGAVTAGELVLTNLGREASPVIRYRTGDMVRATQGRCACGRSGTYLEGGVLGRADDMVIVRGVNVYPSGIEDVVRKFRDVKEFEVRVDSSRAMAELVIRIETGSGAASNLESALADAVRRRLNLRPVVESVPPGTLPRYEMKARRFHHGRPGTTG